MPVAHAGESIHGLDPAAATVYGHASWVNGVLPKTVSVSSFRVIIVWRKEADGQWRVVQELLNAGPAADKR